MNPVRKLLARRSLPTLLVLALLATGLPPHAGAGPAGAVPLDAQGRPTYVPGEVVVTLQPGLPLSALGGRAGALARGAGARALGGPGSAFQRLRLAPGEDVPAALAALRADPAVAAADPNYLNYRFVTPGDPRFGDQWGLHNTAQSLTINAGENPYGIYPTNNPPATGDHDLDGPEAWALSTGTGVVIAIIDDGLHRLHPDINGNLESTTGYTPSSANSGYDYAGDGSGADDNPQPVQLPPPCDGTWMEVSHGTHVAGLAAAVDNTEGGVGVAFGATVLSLKVFPDVCNGASDADIIAAINYAGANGVDVANLSLGRNGPISESMRIALANAIAAGTLFVVAAGNEGSNNDLVPVWPANYAQEPSTRDGVISVAATDQADQLASFSNYGPTTVTLASPGVNMFSTVATGTGPTPSYDYAYFNGTSMAAPVVTGVAALLKAAEPSLTPAQIKARLVATGDTLSTGACNTASGKRVNAYNALTNSTSPTPCAVLSVLASEGSSVCLITHLTQGMLPREALEPLRDLREFLWQRGGWGRALVRAYYRGSTAVIAALRAARARQALAAAHGRTGTI
jgi:hypothetical protein